MHTFAVWSIAKCSLYKEIYIRFAL